METELGNPIEYNSQVLDKELERDDSDPYKIIYSSQMMISSTIITVPHNIWAHLNILTNHPNLMTFCHLSIKLHTLLYSSRLY